MRSLEEILKFVDSYNRNIHRIYYHLYLSNNFNYCAIQIITYFGAFEDNIFSIQRILFILKKLLLNKMYNIILNKSQLNWLKYQQKINLKSSKDLPRIFFSWCHRSQRDRCPQASAWQGRPGRSGLGKLLHAQTILAYCNWI